MANADNPNGFKPWSPDPRVTKYNAGDTFAKGDLLMYASGKVKCHDAGNTLAVGVAATDGAAGQDCLVYDDPDTIFIGQCSGTHALASHDGELVDVEGGTGVMEINEDASTNDTVRILRQELVPGSMETGANARVLFTIAEHVHGSSTRAS